MRVIFETSIFINHAVGEEPEDKIDNTFLVWIQNSDNFKESMKKELLGLSSIFYPFDKGRKTINEK